MPLIPEPLLDEIQSRADIAEVIGRYVPLRRAGRHFKALCPFHKERTPSFHVNTEKQIFHCFGCGVGGNIFSFLMQQERLTFPEAVRQMAEQVGVTIPDIVEKASANGHTQQLFTLLEKALRFYERQLAHPEHGRQAREYLTSRGVTAKTREVFHLGVTPVEADGLIRAAGKSQIPLALLEQAGLSVQSQHGPIDRFRQRLLFPIHDVRGRVMAFGGRSLAGQEPKYLNSPESPVYSKGRQLFGLFQAKDAIVKAKSAIVVEGYFDCVVLWQYGFGHVVSPSGTAFTPEQARVLARYTDSVILAFDPDAAGQAATLRGIEILVEAGHRVHIAQLPSGGADPDELVRGQGANAFQRLLDEALGIMDFLLLCAGSRYNLREAEARVQAAQWILPTVAKVPSAMLRTEYVRVLAEGLRLSESAIHDELGKVKTRSGPSSAMRMAPAKPTVGERTEQLLVALIVDQPARWDRVAQAVFWEHIADPRLRRVVRTIAELREVLQRDPTPAQLISRLAQEELGPFIAELTQLAQEIPHPEHAFEECVRRVAERARKQIIDRLRDQLQAAQRDGREEDMTRLLRDIDVLLREEKHGRVKA